MWQTIDRYVKKHHMFCEGDRVILGLSGGADSVLLARYLLSLRDRQQIFIYAVHVNHLLREGEAERDEQFVVDFCEKWKIPYRIFHEDIRQLAHRNKCSEEEAGRMARYACFQKCADQIGCNKIVLAHHGTDLAETMIFRMVRGTGPEGLCAIRPVNGPKVRPFLCIDKTQIYDMLGQLGQDFVEDSTNACEEYSRNYIRHRILPLLCEMNQQTIDHMSQLADQLCEQNEYLREQMDRLYETIVYKHDDGQSIDRKRMEALSGYERKEMIRRMIFQVGGHRKDITSTHVEMVCGLLAKAPGKKQNLPYHLMAMVDEKSLWITKKSEDPPKDHALSYLIDRTILERDKHLKIRTDSGDIYTFEIIHDFPDEKLKNNFVKYFDYDMIKKELLLRNRRPGDYFIMDSSGHKKMLKRYFIDEKIAAARRNDILLLAEESHVLWIYGGRISASYKLTKQTQNILKMEVYTE